MRDAKGEFKIANEMYEKSISIFQHFGVSNASDFATLLNNYSIVKLRANGGLVFGKQNSFNYEKPEFQYAKDIMEMAYRIFEALSATSSNPNLATVLNNLGISQHNLNQERIASKTFLKSYDFCVDALGEKHHDVATVLNNQAALLSSFSRDDEAWPLYLRSYKIYEDALGGNHPHLARCLNNLGILEHERGNFSEAKKIYLRAFDIYHSTLGDQHCDTAQIQSNLALLNIQQGNLNDGADLLKIVLEVRINSLGAHHPQVANSYIHLGRALFMQKEYAQSYTAFINGLKLIKDWVGDAQYIDAMMEESEIIALKGGISRENYFDSLRPIFLKPTLGDSDLGKFLNDYIAALMVSQSDSRSNSQNVRSSSGSFLRMQLEVLDISFKSPISLLIT